MSRPKWISDWFSSIIDYSSFNVQPIELKESKEWALIDGAIRHRTGLFFSVVGINWKSPDGADVAQPLIEQREIGTLGFLLRDSDRGPELLVQAKIEPGNVSVVQLAPSCQATASNSLRVHGGSSPPYIEYFPQNSQHFLSRSLQSEHGNRFLGKMNRNILTKAAEEPSISPTHKWIPVNEVLHFLNENFLFNTDARSVLVSVQWDELAGREPFSGDDSALGKDLRASYLSENGGHYSTDAVKADIFLKRQEVEFPESVPIESLIGWRIVPTGFEAEKGSPFAVRQIRVTAYGREVPVWDQPIIESVSDGRIDLVIGRIAGVLHILLKPESEPGLVNRVELGPSVVTEPGETNDGSNTLPSGQVVAQCWQSDEGGRFYQDKSLYRVIDVGDVSRELLSEGYWLTLSQIQKLLLEGGWINNEGRSALSMLLQWL